jgi:hypothetical protein
MSAVVAAASMYPIAHPDCISPIALARCWGGQLSDTSTAPADQAPPSPNPTTARHAISEKRPTEVAEPAEPIE